MDGGFVNTRLSAFGAALVTPVLLEFGALKWLLERLLVGKTVKILVDRLCAFPPCRNAKRNSELF